jgi:hypothetical protein
MFNNCLPHPDCAQDLGLTVRQGNHIEKLAQDGCGDLANQPSSPERANNTDWAYQQRVLLRALKRLSPEVMEALLSRIHGGPMLLAALAYGCGVRLSSLRFVRMRNIYLSRETIELEGKRHSIPVALIDDLREYLHQRMCGSEACDGVFRREALLFTPESFVSLRQHAELCILQGAISWIDSECARLLVGDLSERFLETSLLLLSRQHRRRLAAKEKVEKVRRKKGRHDLSSTPDSPLELLDKGPMIVRRDRAGGVNAYYLWRCGAGLS